MRINEILECLKKFIFSIIVVISFIIILCIMISGLGNQKTSNTSNSNNNDVSNFSIEPNNIVFNNSYKNGPKIKIYRSKLKKIQEMYLEEYVTGVVCAEMPAEFQTEALKAQAVAARTYALAHVEGYGGNKCSAGKGANLCDTVHCQVFMDKENRLKLWPKKEGEKYWGKITQAVQATKGQVLTYNKKLVLEPYYFATSSGKTESSSEVFSASEPYLKSVSSPGEEKAPKYKSVKKLTYNEFVNKVNKSYSNAKMTTSGVKSKVKIKSRTEGGSVKEIQLGNVTISGVNFRSIMGLNSANFNMKFNSKNIEISCMGYGHGVGMSQWGANAMAKTGKGYKDILEHYYNGVKIEILTNINK